MNPGTQDCINVLFTYQEEGIEERGAEAVGVDALANHADRLAQALSFVLLRLAEHEPETAKAYDRCLMAMLDQKE